AYLLARRLGIGPRGGLAAAVLALLVPDGAFTVGLLAEPYAYPLLLLGVLVAVDAIAAPTVWRQLAVVGMTIVLPLVPGAQFFVYGAAYLPASYLAGPWSPRAYLARQRVVLLCFAIALAAVAADLFVHGSGRIAK